MTAELFLNFERRYPSGVTIRADLHLLRQDAPVTVFFGPSGSGKTTILRCIAGLEHPDAGIIRFGEEVWFNASAGTTLSPQSRRIGYLSQEHALFPHLNIRRNLEYGLRQKSRIQRQRRVSAVLDLFGLNELKDRYPKQLSGGQMQRAALARAVAPEPRLLLLDEPLSALDDLTRSRLRGDLRALLLRVNIPTIVVTHDRTEAIALGDRLAVIAEGRIQQIGPVQEVFSHPANHLAARSVGVETVIPGRITGRSNGLLTVRAGQQYLAAVDTAEFEGPDVHLCIRAEEVILERETYGKGSARNHLPGRITCLTPEGPLIRVELDCGFPLTALVTRQSGDDLALGVGDTLTAVIKATSVHLIPRG